MVIFHSYVKLPEGKVWSNPICQWWIPKLRSFVEWWIPNVFLLPNWQKANANHAMVFHHISHDSNLHEKFPKKILLKGQFSSHFSTSLTFFSIVQLCFFQHFPQFWQGFSPHFHNFPPFSLGFSHFFSIFAPGFSARSSNVWTLDARLVSSDIAAGDRFGNAVKVAGAGRGIFPVIFGSLWWVIWWWFSWVIYDDSDLPMGFFSDFMMILMVI